MKIYPITRFKVFLQSGSERTIRAKHAIVKMFFNKGVSIILSMLYVPLFLNCLDQTRYGIWVTIMSFVNWIGFFDIGFGQGLRNSLAEALAKNEIFVAKKMVSTTYAATSVIFISLILIFIILYPWIDWYKIVNAPIGMAEEINVLIILVVTIMCVNFILGLFKSILLACQMPDTTSTINLITQALSLLIIYVFFLFGQITSLVVFGLILVVIPVFTLLFYSIIYFHKKFKFISPSIKCIDIKYIKKIMSLGLSFFFIQISNLLLFQSNNLILSNVISPEAVPEYYVVNKYLSLLLMGFTIITTPFWSAVTDSYAKQDYKWIRSVEKKLLKIYFLFCLLCLVLIIGHPLFFKLWIGNKLEIRTSVVCLMAVFILLQMFSNIYLSIINGIGKIRLQLYVTLLLALIYVPFSVYGGYIGGVQGVILVAIVMISVNAVIYPIQYYKLMNMRNPVKGIWYE